MVCSARASSTVQYPHVPTSGPLVHGLVMSDMLLFGGERYAWFLGKVCILHMPVCVRKFVLVCCANKADRGVAALC